MDFTDLNDFLGIPKGAELGAEVGEEDEEELEYDPVPEFDFHNTDPLSEDLLQYHHPQLNWLLREIMNVKALDGRDFDKVEDKNKEIQGTILELVRAAKTSEKQGNQWRAEYEAQAEYNDMIGRDILQMTDRMEYIKGLLSNTENMYQEYDDYSEMKWRKTLRKLDKDLKKFEGVLQDLTDRYTQELKASRKSNETRNQLLRDLDGIAEDEGKFLLELEKEKQKQIFDIERERANPSPRKNILEEFKNRKKKLDERKKSAREQEERAETAGSRPGGRFTGRITPRGGTMNLAKGVVKAQREIVDVEMDPFLRRGIYGNRIAVDRRGGPDPVAALFNQSGETGIKTSAVIPAQNEDDYAEFLATPRRGYDLDTARASAIPDDKRILDPSKGPVKRSAAVKHLPRLEDQ